jgi:hypothetical protein
MIRLSPFFYRYERIVYRDKLKIEFTNDKTAVKRTIFFKISLHHYEHYVGVTIRKRNKKY